MRLLDDARVGRSRARAIAPLLVASVAGASLSCQGNCPLSATGPTPVQTIPVIRPRYVLVNVNGVALPAILAEGGTTRVRLLADTLLFDVAPAPVGGTQPTSGTYSEIIVLGTLQTNGAETVTRTASGSRTWSRPVNNPLTLEAFTGGGPITTVVAGLSDGTTSPSTPAVLNVFTAGRTYAYEAR